MRSHPAFQRGLAAACSSGGLLLVAVYTLYAPTRDLRARIPFLLDLGGGLLTLIALAILFAAGLTALRLTGPVTKEALAGVAVGSLASLLVLTSGVLPRVLPQFPSVPGRGVVFGVAAIMTVALLLRRR